jgi:hypothetical protein
MIQKTLYGRLLVVALAAGTAAPVLAQRGPPVERDRQEEESDGARGEVRRVGRDRGESKEEAASRESPVEGQAPPAQGRGFERGRERPVQDASQTERRPQQGNARRDAMREPVQNAPVDDSRQQRGRQFAPEQDDGAGRDQRYGDNRNDGDRGRGQRGYDARGNDPRQAPPLRDQPYQAERGREGGYGRNDDRSDGRNRDRNEGRGGPQSHDRGRLPERDRQRLITQQRQSVDQYRRSFGRGGFDDRRLGALQQQRRGRQFEYQQRYWNRHREMQARWSTRRFDYNSDPYFYTPASYRYLRGGRYYEVNRYAADLLQQAIQFGYDEGVRAGEADRYDGWRGGYQDNYAYVDANYGYDGYYVSQNDYNYYFREGFRRGYEDGFGQRYRYGRARNGEYVILASALALILNLEDF